jgi:phosphatidylserine decarboxylase
LANPLILDDTLQVTSVDEMLQLFDSFIYDAPEFDVQSKWGGLIAFPFNAVIDWPMTTPAGTALFTSPAVNAAFKKIFDAWAIYLHSKASASVLNEQTGWLSEDARSLLSVPKYDAPQTPYAVPFYDAFKPGPGDPAQYYGFKCWDDFFTRYFKDDVRPLEDPTNPNVIVSGCESDVQRIYRNAKPTDQFWVKSQPYSLLHLLNHDPHYSKYFVQDWDEKTQTGGATVFQAFLSAKSYHRWHTPVGGRILKIVEVAGTYYAVSPEAALDPGAPDLSQPYICQTATRALIFIDADDPIGLMCFVAVGMSEVSTCEVTVKAGQTVEKGDDLGTFHHGGSTHCLVFPNAVGSKLTFSVDGYPDNPPNEWAPKVAPHVNLRRKIAEFSANA